MLEPARGQRSLHSHLTGNTSLLHSVDAFSVILTMSSQNHPSRKHSAYVKSELPAQILNVHSVCPYIYIYIIKRKRKKKEGERLGFDVYLIYLCCFLLQTPFYLNDYCT